MAKIFDQTKDYHGIMTDRLRVLSETNRGEPAITFVVGSGSEVQEISFNLDEATEVIDTIRAEIERLRK